LYRNSDGCTHSPISSATRRTGREAEAILRKCVHCGFCTATCPTYQLLGDELDGPRGRIYLIKQVLEGARSPRRPACTSTAA
jgi:Fe-S oxidoreductase